MNPNVLPQLASLDLAEAYNEKIALQTASILSNFN